MKKFFSEFHYSNALRDVLKDDPMKKDDSMLEIIARNPFTEEGNETFAQIWDAQRTMLSGGGIDYFITTEWLADFIPTYIKGDYSATVLDVFAEHRWSVFVIHPPSPRPAVLVGIRRVNGLTRVVFQERGNRDSLQSNGYGIRPAAFTGGKLIKPLGYSDRLAAGLAMYIRLNPDAVRDGLPEIVRHPNHYKRRRCAGVIIPERLIDRSGPVPRVMIPHPRIAHPRHLRSERFTHKKGCVIQVKETYVIGKCKTVAEVAGLPKSV